MEVSLAYKDEWVHCPLLKLGESALYEEDRVSLPDTRKTKGTLPYCEEEASRAYKKCGVHNLNLKKEVKLSVGAEDWMYPFGEPV